ncbi:MAG: hypothetical protein K1Y02_17200 [Candidatus Hydrogenedentes bacterium]|nr:hypothetical protein [Candidatus Hydrogenedentota bacterium]
MRLLQHAILVVLGVGIFIAGVALATVPVSTLYNVLITKVPVPHEDLWRIGIGLAIAAVALFAILPFGGFRRGRRITFQSAQGNVTFQLDSVEAALRKSLKKLPTVRRVSVEVSADENSRKVKISSNVLLYKAGGASAREAAIQLSNEIARQARQLLGADEVATVDLNIDGIIVDGKDVSTSPVETFRDHVKENLPTGKPDTAKPLVPVSAPASVAAPAAVAAVAAPAPLPDVSEWEAPAPANDDLLTYEDSLKLREDTEHEEDDDDLAVTPGADDEESSEAGFTAELPHVSESTSFDSLTDDDERKPDEDKPALS